MVKKYLCLGTSFALAQALGNAYFLLKSPTPNNEKKPKRDLADMIGKYDFYVCMMGGICAYAFPDRLNTALLGASALDESYRSLTRSSAAFLIGTSLASFCLSDFKSAEDKKKFFLARIWVQLKSIFLHQELLIEISKV